MRNLDTDWIIQESTNLTQWTSLATNYLASGGWDFVDTNSPMRESRCYRVLSAP
jgi:hypothetical protein